MLTSWHTTTSIKRSLTGHEASDKQSMGLIKYILILEDNSNSPVETEVDDTSTVARGYFSSAREVCTAPASRKRRKVRKYDLSYVKFGFSWSRKGEEPRLHCVVCSDVLSIESMKSLHLICYLISAEDKPVDFFLRKWLNPVAKAQEALYCASLRIAKAAKPHTIAEQLCLPLAKEMTYHVWGEGYQTVKLGVTFKRHCVAENN